jgi:hypothetical protein
MATTSVTDQRTQRASERTMADVALGLAAALDLDGADRAQ